MSAARTVLSVALPIKMVTAMAPSKTELMNLCLVVLIIPFTMPLWDLVVYTTLEQYV